MPRQRLICRSQQCRYNRIFWLLNLHLRRNAFLYKWSREGLSQGRKRLLEARRGLLHHLIYEEILLHQRFNQLCMYLHNAGSKEHSSCNRECNHSFSILQHRSLAQNEVALIEYGYLRQHHTLWFYNLNQCNMDGNEIHLLYFRIYIHQSLYIPN
jgi:hypothetical protein